MARPHGSTTTPSYRHHRASGQAICTLNGRDHYLGPWKSKASRVEYDRLIGEWLTSGRQSPVATAGLTVDELIDRYWAFAEPYYTDPSGHTGQLDNLRAAIKVVRRFYGNTPAADFGPIALQTVRDAMVKLGWCRNHVNAQTARVRRMVKWAVGQELLPNGAHHALQAVDGLRFGKCKARETSPVPPAPAPLVDAVLPFLSAQVKAMVELQSITGMRSGELCRMRGCDVDTTAELWVYRPEQHKTKHRGHVRSVCLGKRSQEIITPFLKPNEPTAFLFSPADADTARRAALHAARETPIDYGNAPGTNRKRNPKKKPGEHYTTPSYRRAVAMACRKAFPMPAELIAGLSPQDAADKAREWRRQHQWHPHQLRHSHATNVRKSFGLEGVQAALGQKSVTAAQIYAEQSAEVAQRVAAQMG